MAMRPIFLSDLIHLRIIFLIVAAGDILHPFFMFKEGIKKTIAWYFEHEDWMKNVTSGDYQKYYNEMYETK